MGEQRRRNETQTTPAAPGDTGRTVWVVAVLAFWVSAGVTVTAMLMTGELDLILVSITLGMMILGVWFKVRHQMRLRRARGEVPGGDSS